MTAKPQSVPAFTRFYPQVDPHFPIADGSDGINAEERLRVARRKKHKDTYDVTGRFPAHKPADKDERPPFEFYAWFGKSSPFRCSDGADYVQHGGYFHELRARDPEKRRRFRGLFIREGATVELRAEGNAPWYAAVLHVRRWLLLLPLLLAALLLCLCLSFCGNPAESGSPALGFLQGMTQTEGAKSEPVLSVEYASYSSTPDSTLQADRLAQHLTLSLPANCKDGGNPIDSAPSIYIDLNHDGQFEASELVYNPDGDLLKAGTEVLDLEFTQAVPAGTYDALTRWDSVLSSDHSQAAGSATFKWVATFQ